MEGLELMLNLRFLPVNQAWAWIFGNNPSTMQIISVDGRRLFESRKSALDAARRVGMDV